jgi:fumarylacetoacetate (FAA) hydrolase family protein
MSQTSAVTSLSDLNAPARDLAQGTWISRAWIPGASAGPAVVLLKDGQVHDISTRVATVSALLELDDPVAYLRPVAV